MKQPTHLETLARIGKLMTQYERDAAFHEANRDRIKAEQCVGAYNALEDLKHWLRRDQPEE